MRMSLPRVLPFPALTLGSRLRAPERLRAFIRGRELGFFILALASGVLAGLAVAGISGATQWLHQHLFDLAPGQKLSAYSGAPTWIMLVAPALGAVLLGLFNRAIKPWASRTPSDPIEANALHGGRLSARDTLTVVGQNIISNGFGASIGVEAGYSQAGAGIASWLGKLLQLRRSDLRTLVGCGAGAAIGAAFNAPLAGAFYGIELIIGSYSLSSLLPVVASSYVATAIAGKLLGSLPLISVGKPGMHLDGTYPMALLLGLLAGGLGILVMQIVTTIERMASLSKIPGPVRPVIGGIFIGVAAVLSPQVLSAGHGAMHLVIGEQSSGLSLSGVLILKILASAVAIGTGFRGGLFFASLFMGTLLGKIFALAMVALFPTLHVSLALYAIIGMSAVAVSVIGGPMTMTFLALEMTGNFQITGLVVTGVMASAMLSRQVFGYSFATWRFHLRGENIRSAHDVGLIRDLTVMKLMRTGVKSVHHDLLLSEFRAEHPPGSAQRFVVIDNDDRYVGLILVSEAHAVELDQHPDTLVGDVMRYRNEFLLPEMNAKQAVQSFNKFEAEELAVLDTGASRRVVGVLTEAHTLRRYAEELDRIRRAAQGER